MAKNKDPRTVGYKEALAKQVEKLSGKKVSPRKDADLAGVGKKSK